MKKKFSGALGEPIFLQSVGLMLSEEERKAAEKDLLDSVVAARSAKLALLFDHYGVDHGRFAELAMAMAVDLIPGFQITTERKGAGPKRKWDNIASGYLVVEIDRLISKNSHLSVTSAAGNLAKREPWKNIVRGTNPGETLRQQYEKAKKDKWATVCRDQYRFHEADGTLDKWDAMVRELGL